MTFNRQPDRYGHGQAARHIADDDPLGWILDWGSDRDGWLCTGCCARTIKNIARRLRAGRPRHKDHAVLEKLVDLWDESTDAAVLELNANLMRVEALGDHLGDDRAASMIAGWAAERGLLNADGTIDAKGWKDGNFQ